MNVKEVVKVVLDLTKDTRTSLLQHVRRSLTLQQKQDLAHKLCLDLEVVKRVSKSKYIRNQIFRRLDKIEKTILKTQINTTSYKTAKTKQAKQKHKLNKEQQNNRCKICNKEAKLVFDHSHTTHTYRGAICGDCNFMLGFAKDNIQTLLSAVQYLQEDVDRRGNKAYSQADTAGSESHTHPLTYHNSPNSPSEDNSIVGSNNPGSVQQPLPGQVSAITATYPIMNDKTSLSIEDILINL